ncbi:MAG: MarR family transcriptional regulator [bacterium]|nr:MarR family transcriptional regulator [bacterium]
MQELLQISNPAISYILNSLEKKSYITREINPNNKRKFTISATPAVIEA